MNGRSVEARVDIRNFDRRTERLEEAVAQGVRDGMVLATRGALRSARKAIELSGTKGSKARFAGEYLPAAGPGNSDGRNDSGLMSDSLTVEIDEIARYKSIGRVGWLDEYEEYFKYQEEGFDSVKAWDWRSQTFRTRKNGESTPVRGMFIFKDIKLALRIASAQIAQQVDKNIKGIK